MARKSGNKIVAIIVALIFIFLVCTVLVNSDTTESTDNTPNFGYEYSSIDFDVVREIVVDKQQTI